MSCIPLNNLLRAPWKFLVLLLLISLYLQHASVVTSTKNDDTEIVEVDAASLQRESCRNKMESGWILIRFFSQYS